MSSPTSIRFPAPLLEQLEARAAAERRTLSNLVMALLAGALDARAAQVPTEQDWVRMFHETFQVADGDR